MTKEEVAEAYERIGKELDHLHLAGSEHISRADNNWQFEARFSMQYIAERIRVEYNVGQYKGGGAHARNPEIDRLREVVKKGLKNTDFCPWCKREEHAGVITHTTDCSAFTIDGTVR